MQELRVRVAHVADEAEGVRSFTLLPVGDIPLPPATPGAHLDVHLAVGLTRQYSITNGPEERGCYRIAVKLEPMSRGGSQTMHARVLIGNDLSVSAPRNNFPLCETAERHLLLAGGIGITPLLSMAKHLAARPGARFRLHYFARAPRFAAFSTWLGGCAWRDDVEMHFGLDRDSQRELVQRLLGSPAPGVDAYMCGPGPFMEMVATVAREAGWTDDRVHCEFFSPPTPAETAGGGFELYLARTGRTLQVTAGQTIVEAMRAAGIDCETACEQGICGTCVTTVLEGEPDQRDRYFSDAERAEGKQMLVCVSRARSKRLVIDR
jgi:vanillate O-demethylase ferredoxin subunit